VEGSCEHGEERRKKIVDESGKEYKKENSVNREEDVKKCKKMKILILSLYCSGKHNSGKFIY
jgi:hypothetical protein